MSQAIDTDAEAAGTIRSVSGPVVTATGLHARMNDVVYVGDEGLMGEVIEIEGDVTTVQVYEETSGVSPGEPVENTGEPLTVDLGPGLLDTIYDGVQRPLDVLESRMGTPFLDRGVDAPGIDLEKTWTFTPDVAEGDSVEPGDVVGRVPETESIEHRVMVPPDSDGGTVSEAKEGAFTVQETVITLDNGEEISMHQEWPVREARPSVAKHSPTIPLVSGQRILDGLFPIAKGGTAAIPGPFGSGKCVTPDTPIMFADGTIEPIEQVFDRFAGENLDSEEVLVEAEADILTFDRSSGSIGTAPISHVYRGKTDRLVRVRTASGRELEITPAHKLFRMNGNLQIEEVPAANLSIGESIVMPRKLEVGVVDESVIDVYDRLPQARVGDDEVIDEILHAIEEASITKKELTDRIGVSYDLMINYTLRRTRPQLSFVKEVCDKLGIDPPHVGQLKPGTNGKIVRIPSHVDTKFAEFLGLLLSDGMILDRTIRFFNNDDDLRDRFSELVAELFDCNSTETVQNTVKTVIVHSRVVAELLASLGVPTNEKSKTCSVPRPILTGPQEVVSAFLRGYYLGDGSFSGGTMEIGTSSKTMASGLTYLLARVGILFRVGYRDNGAVRVTVTGADELRSFYRALESDSDFIHDKIDRIGSFAEITVGNTNVDTVPVDATTMVEIAETATYSTFTDAGIEPHNYTGLGQRPSRFAFDRIGEVVADGGYAIGDRVEAVSSMMTDVFFDPIVEIEEISGTKPVYDVTVPGTHNFVGGHLPAILHNTVAQHQLAKWADADIVVYVGCGERGNEMTEVINDFPELEDPKTGKPLMSRTCLIANTSNMPVAARESCVYTGITIAEYFRDMGYDVALMADSTSRWAEAMREISSRLEEMPGEEGYPAYLAARLAQFYERAGLFDLLNGEEGSISVIGAVSPPGGDFSEPVTQNTLRIVKTFWALDADLAERRHFPSINWNESYSLYRGQLDPWYREEVAEEYPELRQWAIDTLDEEAELQEIVQLVGKDALPEDQQLTLEVARYLRDAWLAQNAFHDVDTYCEPMKTYRMLQAIQTFNDEAESALDAGVPVSEIQTVSAAPQLNRMGTAEQWDQFISELESDITDELRELY